MLHPLLVAGSQAAEMIEQLMVPLEEGVNEHKRLQLRELAELNGMLTSTTP